jgi:hypothetical protein
MSRRKQDALALILAEIDDRFAALDERIAEHEASFKAAAEALITDITHVRDELADAVEAPAVDDPPARPVTVKFRHRPPTAPMGRFGGCWQWKLGVQVSRVPAPQGTVLLSLLIAEVSIRWHRRVAVTGSGLPENLTRSGGGASPG